MDLAVVDETDLTVVPLGDARTFPAKWYTSNEIFALEQEQIFRKTWQYAGSMAQLQRPGDFFTVEILGEPIVIVRDRDGEIRALSNVCTHRGGPVATGAGQQPVPFFQCRYHAWTFNFDGSVRSAPGLDSLREEKAGLCLPRIRVETWRSLIFITLDKDTPALAPSMAGIDDVLKTDPIGDLKFQFSETFDIKSNWKIFQYNSHECYHCRTIHPDTVFNVLHPESLETLKAGDLWLYTRYKGKTVADNAIASDVQSFGKPQTSDADGLEMEEGGFYALHMFPNLMITYTPPGYAVLVRFIPQGPDRTLLVRDHYSADADAEKIASAKAFREAVIAEDIEICETVQKNMSSRLFDRGRFVARNEWQSYWFEQRVREFIVRGTQPPA
ncbi:MAG TPA: aromatic ring-hydroxylating dioxygenase subunit alpha [Sphingobium sp.]